MVFNACKIPITLEPVPFWLDSESLSHYHTTSDTFTVVQSIEELNQFLDILKFYNNGIL